MHQLTDSTLAIEMFGPPRWTWPTCPTAPNALSWSCPVRKDSLRPRLVDYQSADRKDRRQTEGRQCEHVVIMRRRRRVASPRLAGPHTGPAVWLPPNADCAQFSPRTRQPIPHWVAANLRTGRGHVRCDATGCGHCQRFERRDIDESAQLRVTMSCQPNRQDRLGTVVGPNDCWSIDFASS